MFIVVTQTSGVPNNAKNLLLDFSSALISNLYFSRLQMHERAFDHYFIAFICWCCMADYRSRTRV